MQTYTGRAGAVQFLDGEITENQLQNIETSPVQLVPNVTGRAIPIFFNLFFQMEISAFAVPFQLLVTTFHNKNTFGQYFGALDIPITRTDYFYVIQPSQNNPFVDSPFYFANSPTSDNNLILTSGNNDGSRQIPRNIKYRVYYATYTV